MKRKRIYLLFVGVLFAGIIVSVAVKFAEKQIGFSEENKPEEVITAATQDTPETDDGNPNILAHYRGNLYTQADEVETDGLVYKINKVSKSKDA